MRPTFIEMQLLLAWFLYVQGYILSVDGLSDLEWDVVPATTWWPRYKGVEV